MILHSILAQKLLTLVIVEVSTTITDYNSWHTKPWEYDSLEKSANCLGVSIDSRNSFNPFGHIVHNNKDMLIALRRGQGSNKVYFPNIKQFHFQDSFLGHFISP
jgi:hypothetical protein